MDATATPWTSAPASTVRTRSLPLYRLFLMICCNGSLNEGSDLIVFMAALIGSHYACSASHLLISLLLCIHLCVSVAQVTLRSPCRTSCLSSSARRPQVWWSLLPWWLSLLSALSKCLIFITDKLNYMFSLCLLDFEQRRSLNFNMLSEGVNC